MKYIFFLSFLVAIGCTSKSKSNETQPQKNNKIDLVAMLDTVWQTEQIPIRQRDSIGKVFGYESEEFNQRQVLVTKNHAINEQKIRTLLDNHGWPSKAIIGERGNHTICNVLQHSDLEVREKYIPMMKAEVMAKNLLPRWLARAEDRIATDKGELQIYGGQIKYYPETKSFDVWPIFDPENVDKRRAEIGLEPIAKFLKEFRTPMEWDVKVQIKRSAAFESGKNKMD